MTWTPALLVGIVAAACGGGRPASDAAARAKPAPDAAARAALADAAPATPPRPHRAVTYRPDGRRDGPVAAFVYAPRTSSCRGGPVDWEGSVPYRLVGVWRFAEGEPAPGDRERMIAPGAWACVDTPAAATTLPCAEQPISLAKLMGKDELALGTYWVVAEVDGQLEASFVGVGPDCQDLDNGPAPAGYVVTCVKGPGLAGALFVPDPTDLADGCRATPTCRATRW
jgi:hypothetical protein